MSSKLWMIYEPIKLRFAQLAADALLIGCPKRIRTSPHLTGSAPRKMCIRDRVNEGRELAVSQRRPLSTTLARAKRQPRSDSGAGSLWSRLVEVTFQPGRTLAGRGAQPETGVDRSLFRKVRRRRSDHGSSSWSTPPRNLSQISPWSPYMHRPPRGHAAANANRRSGRHECRST